MNHVLYPRRYRLFRRFCVRGAACIAVAGAQLLFSAEAEAHVGARTDGPWWSRWNWDPVILLNLALLTGMYVLGLRALWRKAGNGRVVSRWQAAAFAGAIVALMAALVSPLDTMSDELSWVHMVQHMTLMMIAAPLLVLSAPRRVLLWSVGRNRRRTSLKWLHDLPSWTLPWYLLWQPLVVWVLYAVVLWLWHLPVLYHAALRNPFIHDFQHLTFFGISCLFWRVLLDPLERLRQIRGVGVLYLFTTSLHASVLGVYMTLSPQVWYGDYDGRTQLWNITPLEDQQLAGLIMWMPACSVYAVAAAAILAVWLGRFQKVGQQQYPLLER